MTATVISAAAFAVALGDILPALRVPIRASARSRGRPRGQADGRRARDATTTPAGRPPGPTS